jgi:hypothetical protein
VVGIGPLLHVVLPRLAIAPEAALAPAA